MNRKKQVQGVNGMTRPRLARGAALALAGLLALAGQRSQAAPPTGSTATTQSPTHFAVAGAELHVGDGTVIANAILVVKDGRIVDVGGPELAAKHAGIETVNLAGKIITPGFIAADARVGLVEIGMERSTVDRYAGTEHPIRAGYDPAPAINATSSLIQVQAIEGITSAAVAPSGGVLSGQVAFIDLLHGDYAGIVAQPGVAIDGSLGQAFGGSRAATLSLLRRTLEDARYYRANRRNFDRGASRELAAHPDDLEALFPVLDKKVPLTLDVHRAGDILAALALAEEFDVDVVLVGAAEGWKVADQIAATKVPVVVMPTENLPGSFDRLGARMDNAALLHAAGVQVVIAELGEAHNLRNVKQQAGVAVAHGLDHEVALQAITLNVAEAYGVDKDYGSLAKGKVANFVVWDHDPFELDSWAEQVYIRGAKIPMVSRQTLLRDRYLERHREAGVLP